MNEDRETYEGPAGSIEYRADMDKAVLLCRMLVTLPLAKMADHVQTVHAVAPMLDPTAYRAGMQNLEDQESVTAALLAARKVLTHNARLWAALEQVGAVTT